MNWCRSKNDIPYFETSARADTNIDIAFKTLIKKTLAQTTYDQILNISSFPITLNINEQNTPTPSSSWNCSC